jgi:hypothetical protein
MLALVDENWPGTPAICPRNMRSAVFTGSHFCWRDASPTAAVLADVLGFNKVGQEEALIRFRAGEQIIPDALQKAKKWATLVEVADSSSLNYRGAAVSAKHPGCGSGRVCLIVAISQSEVL